MKKFNEYRWKVIAIIAAASICFSYYTIQYLTWAIITVLIFLIRPQYITLIPRLRVTKEWILIGFVWLMGSLYSFDKMRGVKYCIAYIIIILLSYSFTNNKNFYEYFIKYLYRFSLVHVFSTLLRAIIPFTIDKICMVILSSDDYASQQSFAKLGAWNGNVGITTQTGWNAFYITIALCIAFTRLVYSLGNKEGKKNFILFLSTMVALLLTNKRSYLMAVIVYISIMLFINIKKTLRVKTLSRIFFLAILGAIAIVLIYKYVPAINTIFAKITALAGSSLDKISSGRISIYKDMILKMTTLSKIIFGYGTGSTNTLMNIDGHNIYLQFFFENGIFAAILLGFVILREWTIALICTNKLKYQKVKNENIAVSFAIQTIFLVVGMFGNPLYDTPMFFTYLVFTFMSNIMMANGWREL